MSELPATETGPEGSSFEAGLGGEGTASTVEDHDPRPFQAGQHGCEWATVMQSGRIVGEKMAAQILAEPRDPTCVHCWRVFCTFLEADCVPAISP
ncbi:MAG TPA: hypothetical protein VMB73_02325 [Acetobacteraceae bacterium]|nr:hypothetical protein [Acetobacteraceae bacterium]